MPKSIHYATFFLWLLNLFSSENLIDVKDGTLIVGMKYVME
jgi:hypothetical protein